LQEQENGADRLASEAERNSLVSRALGSGALVAAAIALVVLALGRGWFGAHEGPGVIEGAPQPSEVVAARAADQQRAAAGVALAAPKSILFGDFHVHTTLSLDAFLMSLPVAGGEGAHPQADACDAARYCSALDFWSINDHAENLTPQRWRETVESIRECNARAGDPASPDTVAYLGWEWTHIGATPDGHWGHKNVVLRDLEDERIPARPISAPSRSTDLLLNLGTGARALMVASRLGDSRVHALARYATELADAEPCPDGVNTRELPRDCMERANTPAELFRKLREWGSATLVIPHGTAWGIYTPAGSSLDKQLTPEQHDPSLQTLIEVYSGHGNSEEYRDWRAVLRDPVTGAERCPEPRPDYLPACWQAGEIVRARCAKAGLDPVDCETRAAEARANYLAAPLPFGEQTVPGSDSDEWRDSGQCRDCRFLPAWSYRPMGSVQYALARSELSDPFDPFRFRFGFIASSDVHSARPGTGYKEYARQQMADFQLYDAPSGAENPDAEPDRPPHSVAYQPRARGPMQFGEGGDERMGSFFFTGGLVAVHTAGRSREAIWDALQRREVYATSGQRTLLWFELENGPAGALPMGSEVALAREPAFRVRALGSEVQLPGCPDYAVRGLAPERLARLCRGECYHPSDRRKRIARIEVVRIRPQVWEGESAGALIEDPWRVRECEADPAGCVFSFSDPEFTVSRRDAVYYVRAIEEPSPAVNGALLACARDESGSCADVNARPAGPDDDRLANVEERAWSSPIFVDYAGDRRGDASASDAVALSGGSRSNRIKSPARASAIASMAKGSS
jgi:hypothetical protein